MRLQALMPLLFLALASDHNFDFDPSFVPCAILVMFDPDS
jgi:hypothetical protein